MTTYSNSIYRTAEPPEFRPQTKATTLAEAGAQSGDGEDDGLRVITTVSQLGPGLRRRGTSA